MLSTLFSVTPTVAASDEEILKHDVVTTRKILVAVEGAFACDEPRETSTCRPMGRGMQLPLLDIERLDAQLKTNTWLRIPSIFNQKVSWWVPRKFVIFYSESPRFSGDWPVRYYYFDTGESRLLIDFDAAGTFKVKELSGYTNKVLVSNGQVYGIDGINQLRFPDRQNPGIVTEPFSFDLKNPRSALKQCEYLKQGGYFCAIGLFSDPPQPVLDPKGKCLRDCASK